MNETWFEEELILSDAAITNYLRETPKPVRGETPTKVEDLAREARGIVRAQKPDWGPLAKDEIGHVLNSSRQVRLFKIRLVFEFEVPKENYEHGARFIYGCCSAHLRTTDGGVQPEVYDLFPRDLYEGDPQTVSLKFGPEITVGDAGVSVGEIGANIAIGQVIPLIAGYFGENKLEPRWEIRPKNKSLLGRQYMWLVLLMPNGCNEVRLATRVEANIQTKYGPFSIGPKEATWNSRPSIVIQ